MGQVEPAAAVLVAQPIVIEGGVGTEQGEAETVLPLDGAVAGAAVAAQPAEDGGNVPAEARQGLFFGRRAAHGQQKAQSQGKGETARHGRTPGLRRVGWAAAAGWQRLRWWGWASSPLDDSTPSGEWSQSFLFAESLTAKRDGG
jgi:hypothetical protein